MKKRAAFLMTAVGVLLLGMASAFAKTERIVIITNAEASDPFWSVVKHGVDDAAKETGVHADFFAPDHYDTYQMKQMIEAAIASNADGVIVSISDPAALKAPIADVIANKIPVIAINSGLTSYKSLGIPAFIGMSSYDAGVAAGERFAQLGVRHAVCANQEITDADLSQRCAGFKKGLGGDVAELDVGKDTTEVRNRLLAYIQSHPGTDGVLATGSSAAAGVIAMIDQGNEKNAIRAATFDLSPDILVAIRDGKMVFAIDQQQYLQGYLSVILMSRIIRYGFSVVGVVPTGPGFVTKENAAAVINLSKQGIR